MFALTRFWLIYGYVYPTYLLFYTHSTKARPFGNSRMYISLWSQGLIGLKYSDSKILEFLLSWADHLFRELLCDNDFNDDKRFSFLVVMVLWELQIWHHYFCLIQILDHCKIISNKRTFFFLYFFIKANDLSFKFLLTSFFLLHQPLTLSTSSSPRYCFPFPSLSLFHSLL